MVSGRVFVVGLSLSVDFPRVEGFGASPSQEHVVIKSSITLRLLQYHVKKA